MRRRFLVSVLLALAAFAHMHSAGAQSYSPPFPRLGAGLPGGNTTGLTAAHAAQVDLMILGAYVGWTNSSGQNANQFAAATKAINPNFKLFVYTVIMQETNPPSELAEGNTQIASVPWWALNNSGGLVSTGGGDYAVNITTNTKLMNGQNYPQWRASRDFSTFLSGKPSLDGFYIDNFNNEPPVSADYLGTGSVQTPSAAQSAWQNGYATYVSALRAASPSNQQLVIGNLATWTVGANISGYTSPSPILNGGPMESIIGQSYSIESYAGWQGMMAYYTHVMASVAAPKLVMFAQDTTTTTDYQGMRYGLASCLMGDAYYFNDINYNDFLTYDEYSFNLGAATTPALVFPGATSYQKGVYRRDFANGIVLVNPKGNGPQTVTLETSYKHLSGTQAPTVNNGQVVTSVTLNDRDGVILQRLTSQPPPPVPDAPTLTVQ